MDAFLGSWKAVLDSDEAKAEFRAYIAAETAGAMTDEMLDKTVNADNLIEISKAEEEGTYAFKMVAKGVYETSSKFKLGEQCDIFEEIVGKTYQCTLDVKDGKWMTSATVAGSGIVTKSVAELVDNGTVMEVVNTLTREGKEDIVYKSRSVKV